MAGSQIATSVTILNSLLGYEAISLTDWATSALTMVAAGSKVEVAGGFFNFASATTPTGFSAMTVDQSAYIALTPSGTAGSQVLAAAWTNTEPVWSTSKQGWYASAGSLTRYVGGCMKVSDTQAVSKFLMPHKGIVADAVVSQPLSGGTCWSRGNVVRSTFLRFENWDMNVSGTGTAGTTVTDIPEVMKQDLYNDAGGKESGLAILGVGAPIVYSGGSPTGGRNINNDVPITVLVSEDGLSFTLTHSETGGVGWDTAGYVSAYGYFRVDWARKNDGP